MIKKLNKIKYLLPRFTTKLRTTTAIFVLTPLSSDTQSKSMFSSISREQISAVTSVTSPPAQHFELLCIKSSTTNRTTTIKVSKVFFANFVEKNFPDLLN
jgi:hypothetical protein